METILVSSAGLLTPAFCCCSASVLPTEPVTVWLRLELVLEEILRSSIKPSSTSSPFISLITIGTEGEGPPFRRVAHQTREHSSTVSRLHLLPLPRLPSRLRRWKTPFLPFPWQLLFDTVGIPVFPLGLKHVSISFTYSHGCPVAIELGGPAAMSPRMCPVCWSQQKRLGEISKRLLPSIRRNTVSCYPLQGRDLLTWAGGQRLWVRGLENMVPPCGFTALRFGRKRMQLERRKYGNLSDWFSGVMMAFFPCFRLSYL